MLKSLLTIIILASSLLFGAGCAVPEDGGPDDATQNEPNVPNDPNNPNPNNPNNPTDPNAPQAGQGGYCPSNTFVGDVEGAQATAAFAVEVTFEIMYIGGEIRSANGYYTFSGGEMPIDAYTKAPQSNVVWVDVVDHATNARFRAEIQFYENGFLFITNAYEGAYSTQYEFVCQR